MYSLGCVLKDRARMILERGVIIRNKPRIEINLGRFHFLFRDKKEKKTQKKLQGIGTAESGFYSVRLRSFTCCFHTRR